MYTPTGTCIVVSRRCFTNANGTLKIIFTPSQLQSSVLVEGRAARNGWEQEDARGRIELGLAGEVINHYSGTMVITNMKTGQVVTQYQAGNTYKIDIANPTSGTYINFLGNKYDLLQQFAGSIHAFRADECHIGYGSPESSKGVASNLHLQFDIWNQAATPPAQICANLQRVSETQMTGAVPNYAGGWTYDSATDTWTSARTGWNRLYAFKSSTAIDGRRPYERLLRVVCDAELNGKVLRFYYESVGEANCKHELVEGHNEFIVYIKENSASSDMRPKFDSIDNIGVKLKNMRVYESIDCRIQGATWVEHRV